MILLICIFRSLAMKTESKTNEIQILNEIWIIFKWFSLCKLVLNILSQKDCEMVNEKQMKSEWSEIKLISNEKWMDFIFIRVMLKVSVQLFSGLVAFLLWFTMGNFQL